MGMSKEPLLKRKAQYSWRWPPRQDSLFCKKEKIGLVLKAADLNKEVNCTDPSPSVRVPWYESYLKTCSPEKNRLKGEEGEFWPQTS